MKVALIGCSGMGTVHAAMATNCGLTLAVCADKKRKAAQTLARQYGAKATDDALAAIKRKDVDIVAIATPTPTHAKFVKAAAKAGKAIFCEKPFCRSTKECKEALKAVEKAGVKLFVGHVVRYFQEFEALRAQLTDGRIGQPGFIKMYRGGIFPVGEKRWFQDYEQSGGVAFDSMIHDLDWLRYVFGEPDRLFCQSLMRSKKAKDYAQATVRMKNGLIATVIGTWAHPAGFRVKVEICGNAGMLQFDSNDSPLAGMKEQTGGKPSMIVPGSPETVSPYELEWEDFAAWLRDEHEPRVTPNDALRAVEMAEAALESVRSCKAVKL